MMFYIPATRFDIVGSQGLNKDDFENLCDVPRTPGHDVYKS